MLIKVERRTSTRFRSVSKKEWHASARGAAGEGFKVRKLIVKESGFISERG